MPKFEIELDLDPFDPSIITIKEGETLEEIEGETYLLTTDFKGNPIKRKIKIWPRQGRCNALTRVGYCHQGKAKGKSRCRFHGANLAKGNKQDYLQLFQSGKYTAYVPKKIQEIYQDTRVADDSDNLNHDITLLDSYAQFYLKQSEHGQDVPELWKQLNGLVWEIKQSLGADDTAAAFKSIEALENLVNPVNRAAMAEKQAFGIMKEKLKFLDRQSAIEHRDSQRALNYDAQLVMTMIFALLEKVHESMISQQISQETREAVLLEIGMYSESEEFTKVLGHLADEK